MTGVTGCIETLITPRTMNLLTRSKREHEQATTKQGMGANKKNSFAWI